MALQYLILILFAFLFVYGFIRPFESIFARLYLIIGSFLGFISVLGREYTNTIARFVGVEHGSYLYLYIGLITMFVFTFYCLNVFSSQQKVISKLAREIALLEEKIRNKKD